MLLGPLMLFYTSSVKLPDTVRHINVAQLFNKLFSPVKQAVGLCSYIFPKISAILPKLAKSAFALPFYAISP
jgi:hypothetical protein